MFNRKIEITKENESILFINAVIENLRYAIVRDDFGIDLKRYPLVGNKGFRNSSAHFDERYYEFNGVGDMNILKADTSEEERRQILSTPHLRTLDIDKWVYYSYDARGNQITLDLQELRTEMYEMLSELCTCDIRQGKKNL